MAVLFLNNTTSGAPVLSGTNGALNAVLDWALVQNGWTINQTATNKRFYKMGSGSLTGLLVQHDSTVSTLAQYALLRAADSATAAATASLTNPWPTTAQVADGSIGGGVISISTVADTSARQWYIMVAPTYFMFVWSDSSVQTAWDYFFFGDMPSADAADAYATALILRGSPGNMASGGISTAVNFPIVATLGSSQGIWWRRSIDGSIFSTRGGLTGPGSGSASGALTSFAAARSGYLNRIQRGPLVVCDIGSASASINTALYVYQRGAIPHIWMALHNGINTMTFADTFTDTAYNAAAVFRPMLGYSTAWVIFETTDTWVAPTL